MKLSRRLKSIVLRKLHNHDNTKWFCNFTGVILALLAFHTLHPIAAWSQTQWIKHNNNPVLDIGPTGAWDGGRIFYYCVFFDGAKYRMWYTGFNPTLNKPPEIGYATSPDGINWTKYANNPVLSPTEFWESEGLAEPVVIFNGAQFQMWYSGNTGTGYATSPDGINWTKYAGNPVLDAGSSGSWDDAGIFPTTVRIEGTTYKMWCTGFDGGVFRFGYATSSDGINWVKHANNPIMNVGPAGSWERGSIFLPDVLFFDNTYHMWYTGFGGGVGRIGHATSTDGIIWVKDPANPILDRGAAGTWESFEVGHPRVLFDGKKSQMWFIGRDAQINIRIGYATATIPTAVSNRESETLITQYALFDNYPNPFNPTTTIVYHLPRASQIKLMVYNLAGQLVRTLVDAPQAAGRFQITWDGRDDVGNGVASGVYLYRLEAGNFAETKKMILMR